MAPGTMAFGVAHLRKRLVAAEKCCERLTNRLLLFDGAPQKFGMNVFGEKGLARSAPLALAVAYPSLSRRVALTVIR